MKLSISRIPSMAEHGEESTVMLNISLQAGKQLAQVMQCLGIQSMRLSSRETMGSQGLGTDETHFFDDVPQPILKWGSNSIYPTWRHCRPCGRSSRARRRRARFRACSARRTPVTTRAGSPTRR